MTFKHVKDAYQFDTSPLAFSVPHFLCSFHASFGSSSKFVSGARVEIERFCNSTNLVTLAAPCTLLGSLASLSVCVTLCDC